MEIDTTDDLTFGFWNGKPGLAFSDICLATEMHLEGQKKKKKTRVEGYNCGLMLDLLASLSLDSRADSE